MQFLSSYQIVRRVYCFRHLEYALSLLCGVRKTSIQSMVGILLFSLSANEAFF
jgi:hypothetical protein